MAIELNGRVVWGTGYSHDRRRYGDEDWKEKIKEYVSKQDFVIVQGRYGDNNLDFHFNIKGFPFSLVSRDAFLSMLDKITVGHTDNVFLYDALENLNNIWSGGTTTLDRNRYIFISHTATECQLL